MEKINFLKKDCPFCGGNLVYKKVEEDAKWGKYSIRLSGIDADVCETCGEVFYSADDARMLQNIAAAMSESKTRDEYEGAVLNLQETAALLRVSSQSVYNMIRDGRLKAKKVGREWRFLKSEIISALDGSDTFQAAARNGGKMSQNDLDEITKLLNGEKNNE